MKHSETKIQFSLNEDEQDKLVEKKRALNKEFAYSEFKYQWEHYPKIRKVAEFPLNIDIEVSSLCNLRCDHCFRQYMDIGSQSLMSFEMYRRIVDECSKYRIFTLKFSMRGEPTLNPHIVEMVDYAKKRGIKEVWLNTHGGNLTEKMVRGILQARVDWITMSFDGLGEMYESIRLPLKYEESLEKLKMLSELRDECSPDTILNVQTLWSAIKDDPQAYIDVMKPLVDRIAYNSDMNFKEFMLVPDPDFVCLRLWQRLAICSDGDYLKCPSDFKKQEVLGNFNEITIKDAWDILQEQQRMLHERGYINLSKVCSECHHGCKKVKRVVKIGDKEMEGYNYEFEREFSGVGLNRD